MGERRRWRGGASVALSVLGGLLPLAGSSLGGSVFVGAHDRQDARRDGGISGIGRAELGGAVVAVDFPKVADAALVDRAEVVFAVGIVVVSEDVEGAHLLQERATLIDRHGFDAGGDHDHAADEGAAEGVVEGADAFDGGHGGAGHGFVS